MTSEYLEPLITCPIFVKNMLSAKLWTVETVRKTTGPHRALGINKLALIMHLGNGNGHIQSDIFEDGSERLFGSHEKAKLEGRAGDNQVKSREN